MIGVVAQPGDEVVVREFFELFKTPWEFAQAAGRYAVLLCGHSNIPPISASLTLCFADGGLRAEGGAPEGGLDRRPNGRLRFADGEIPLYGDCLPLRGEPFEGVTEVSGGGPAAVASQAGGTTVVRLGYDLFGEVQYLLTAGQPIALAEVPSLELHIALLRRLISAAGLSFVEIPPVPAGFPFMACLTHDVDHPILRHHRFDHTLAGFLYRSTLGSCLGLMRGRLNHQQLFENLRAAVALPFLHCGLAPDIWRQSLTDYAGLELGLGSTFFVIPFRGRAGRALAGQVAPRRAAAYEPSDIQPELSQLLAAGHEVGVHGLDAWCDPATGGLERRKIADLIGTQELGVRMHWLWFDYQSPLKLEQAGFSYDSTVGYNQTVGFRAGTTQVYRPLNATRLLELPLHLMDTALFYPSYLDLPPDAARQLVSKLLDHSARFGGALTINWHDRSLAPERLWGGFYRWLLEELKARGAWFPAAGQAVAWFRRRRSVVFESLTREGTTLKVRLSHAPAAATPGLRLRLHRPLARSPGLAEFVDLPCRNGELALAV